MNRLVWNNTTCYSVAHLQDSFSCFSCSTWLRKAVCGSDLLKQISLLDVIFWVSKCWKEVEDRTIQKCFYKAGFAKTPVAQCESESNCDSESDQRENPEDEDDDIPLAVLKLSYDLFGCPFQNLTEIDATTHTCDTNTIDWEQPASILLKELNCQKNDENSESGSDDETEVDVCDHVPSLSEANEMLFKLKSFAIQKGHSNMISIISELDNELSVLSVEKSTQSKITDFFFELNRNK